MSLESRATFDRNLENSFLQNLSKLSFLPKLVSFGVLLFILYIFSIINNLGYIILPEKTVNNYLNLNTPISVIKENEALEIEASKKASLASQTKLSLIQNDSSKCTITLANSSNLETLNFKDQIFWKAENCSLPLQIIQISVLSQADLDSLEGQKNIYLTQLQGSVYSILYSNQAIDSVDLDFLKRYWFELSQPLFSDSASLVKAISTDQVSAQNIIYFLSGNCFLKNPDSCSLATLDTQKNNYQQISNNILPLLNSQVNNGQIFFAREQDEFPKAINFIITSPGQESFKLVRYSLETNNVLQILEINKNSDPQNYKKYFR